MKSLTVILLLVASMVCAQTTMNIYQSNGTVLQIPLSSIDSITYTVQGSSLATLTTTAISNISQNTASGGGNVVADGGSTVTARGICWSTSQNPTTANSKTSNGTGTGNFSSSLTGLAASTTYYVRAYATNSAGTAYGNQMNFTTSTGSLFTPGSGVTDIDGNFYNTIILGTQEWMKENLKTTRYANGNAITTGLSNINWQNTTDGAYAIYDNNAANNSIYGKLYNYYAVADSRNVCPAGWHAPTEPEWETLITYLGGASIAGGKMKTLGLWNSPNTGATNISDFSALPSGGKDQVGNFYNLTMSGNFWTSTPANPSSSAMRYLTSDLSSVTTNYNFKVTGLSVRCVKN